MEHETVRDRLRVVMASVFETTSAALPRAADTENVEKWDSLGHLLLIESVEEAFGVRFDHEETLDMLCEDDLLMHLAARLGATPATTPA